MLRLIQMVIVAMRGAARPTGRPQNARRLSDLDARLLDDIGITREQARDIDQKTTGR